MVGSWLVREVPDVVDAVEALVFAAGGAGSLIEPRGYPHLGVAIVDSLFSLRADYDTVVVPLLRRYCDGCGLGWDERFNASAHQHGTGALIGFLGPMSTDQRCALLNRQVSPGTSKRKANVCVEVATVFDQAGIDSTTELAHAVRRSAALEWAVRDVSGVGPATWSYLLNLSRVEVSKPDTMVVRWVETVTGHRPSQAEAAVAIEHAAEVLASRHHGLTVRMVDHLVWRAASGRSLSNG